MAKINITKPTGTMEVLSVLSAFKSENNTYVILDSEKMGSMGLPIIYVSKFIDKLEKINDDNEWQSVKNYLKGIINGANFEYVKINDQISADEVYYTPLTLPQNSYDLIKSRYKVDNINLDTSSELEPNTSNVAPVTPIMPSNNVTSNVDVTSVPVTNNVNPSELELQPIKAVPISKTAKSEKVDETASQSFEPKGNTNSSFNADKETFLKACENMFDALISKYQKQLAELDQKEQELLKKEQEIEMKLKNANEHLANAEAREQVANIAHDNAQRIMDISNLMPNNPNGTQTGVI